MHLRNTTLAPSSAPVRNSQVARTATAYFLAARQVGVSPSWFRWHPTLPVLYTTNETFAGEASSITAFRLTAGALFTTQHHNTTHHCTHMFTTQPNSRVPTDRQSNTPPTRIVLSCALSAAKCSGGDRPRFGADVTRFNRRWLLLPPLRPPVRHPHRCRQPRPGLWGEALPARLDYRDISRPGPLQAMLLLPHVHALSQLPCSSAPFIVPMLLLGSRFCYR